MYYPTIVVEDFFKDPNLILNFYKKVKWFKPKKNENWPGVRSKPFYKINIDFSLPLKKKYEFEMIRIPNC